MSLDRYLDFRTWLNHNKIDSATPMLSDIRCVLDKATFRYIKCGGFSIDNILIKMKEDGWLFEDDAKETQLDFNTFIDFVERNPLTPAGYEYVQNIRY